jgi:hypothetical protein
MHIKSFMGYFYRGYFCLHTCRGYGVLAICNNGLQQRFISLRDGYVIYCHLVCDSNVTFCGVLVFSPFLLRVAILVAPFGSSLCRSSRNLLSLILCIW